MIDEILNSPFRRLALVIFTLTLLLSGIFWSVKITKYEKYTLEKKLEGVKSYSLNLNLAKTEEFSNLPGIGPELASKITSYREQIGGFKSLEQIKQVKGIGNKKYAAIKEFISL